MVTLKRFQDEFDNNNNAPKLSSYNNLDLDMFSLQKQYSTKQDCLGMVQLDGDCVWLQECRNLVDVITKKSNPQFWGDIQHQNVLIVC